MALLPRYSVYPSAGDFAARSAPMLPPPPATFSITTGCFSRSASTAATCRPTASVSPPGGYGTMILIGFSGHAAPAPDASTQTAISDPSSRRTNFMAYLLVPILVLARE